LESQAVLVVVVVVVVSTFQSVKSKEATNTKAPKKSDANLIKGTKGTKVNTSERWRLDFGEPRPLR
jgi:hypothetical protein